MRKLGFTPAERRAGAPSILQMEAVECGAASLAMVLAYYKKYISLEELRAACGVSRDGSKALNLIRAAREYGLISRGLRKEPDDLRSMTLPMIVFWNFNHFVVVDGFAGDKILLNDPAMGRRIVTSEEFDQSFTGVVLTFEKGPDFVPSGQKPSITSSLRTRLVGARMAILFLVLSGLALVVPGLVIPAFTSTFIDQVLVGRMKTWVLPLILIMLGTSILTGVLTWLQRHFLLKLEMRIALSTSANLFWHVLRLPIGFYIQRSAGDIGARVGINDRVAKVLSGDVATGMLSVLTAIFFAVIMLFYDVAMSLVTIGIVALNLLILCMVAQRRTELNQKLSIDQGKVMGISMNGLTLIESLKASGSESDFFSRWAGYQARLANSMQAMNRSSIVLDIMPKFLTTANTCVILGIGGIRTMNGDMTIGTLVAFQALIASFVNPTNILIALGGKVQTLAGDMARLDDVANTPCEDLNALEHIDDVLNSAKLEGSLELRNVTFGYSRHEPPLLENFNLTLKPGHRVALVGSSGCGKSSIAKLVLGLYQPWSGEILFDGKPRSEWPRRQFLNSVAAVDQDIALFSGTIRENLVMWDSTVPPPAMVKAAKDACLHDMISARTGGYDSLVSEGGSNFSGGQRQRMEIARALTSNPRLLVLDEATSALDPVTEAIVNDNLRHRGCSCLVIAHRLSSIRDCDEIILLDKGKVVERGTHDELMTLRGKYAELISNE
ncbi:NHLP family bacteriocin export ABC transporter peptidase/permease/ATPase subunit [Massilia pinisoli]|uniref:NHLP family bacteriocin export ABC transporter peptidase/permease/ATPase subunit n=2 Tax=Massilia pinisoli TaxID=1772194 RepID=A0ABT1ZUN4_9BURK|nr:NHLP family bacteriocin export ABC transporter peptidase/permease/ATPase subunit [Massilia pinisoli]MCS0583569.1 NHLP family bacteriocin export ABC transporter peptidase/permease/ATPase subunit [Massilia pinisoli]